VIDTLLPDPEIPHESLLLNKLTVTLAPLYSTHPLRPSLILSLPPLYYACPIYLFIIIRDFIIITRKPLIRRDLNSIAAAHEVGTPRVQIQNESKISFN
jgi:hypothetical protein